MAGAGMGMMRRGISWTSVPDDTEGLTKEFPDVDFSVSGVKTRNSNNKVTCRLVKNSSGGALLPSVVVEYKAGAVFQEVDAAAGATAHPAGVVDEYLPAAGVPDGSWFWIVVHGPTKAIDSGSGITAEVPVATAASGYIADASSPPTEYDLGFALAEISATETGRIFVNLPYT
ncbi:hypothetical protein CMI37_31650 [Candidatus Pacearchaeota archaeon]|nr:hypothetical protein [Candidatus Pacearchaeota archaeon]